MATVSSTAPPPLHTLKKLDGVLDVDADHALPA
jgi:hypothetical protein